MTKLFVMFIAIILAIGGCCGVYANGQEVAGSVSIANLTM
jgi:hypothetical protein